MNIHQCLLACEGLNKTLSLSKKREGKIKKQRYDFKARKRPFMNYPRAVFGNK